MNRRKFFGMTAAALMGADLPLSLLPEKSIFLAPRQGWYPSDFVMREMIQFNLTVNKFAVRHDTLFCSDDEQLQPYTLVYLPDSAVHSRGDLPLLNDSRTTIPDVWMFDDAVLRELRQNARNKFARMAFRASLNAPKRLLPILRGVEHARYV